MNRRQLKMLTQIAERQQHAPGAAGNVKWAVQVFVDGEMQCEDRVFAMRHSAEEHARKAERRAARENGDAAVGVEFRIVPVAR